MAPIGRSGVCVRAVFDPTRRLSIFQGTLPCVGLCPFCRNSIAAYASITYLFLFAPS